MSRGPVTYRQIQSDELFRVGELHRSERPELYELEPEDVHLEKRL